MYNSDKTAYKQSDRVFKIQIVINYYQSVASEYIEFKDRIILA